MFQALLLDKGESFSATVKPVDESALPPGDVLVRVLYSTLNYKDGLAITNKGPVVRQWPMVAGIDGAGEVIESSHPAWKPGDAFIHNGWGVGETHWGCLAEKARLKGDWLVKLPAAFRRARPWPSARPATPPCCVCWRWRTTACRPGAGEMLVTGATGGVGSVAVALLGRLGYTVVAATGKVAEADWLKRLGASSVIDRAELAAPGKPFQKERWAGVVDAVGSHTLANALAQTRYGGVVAACGLAQGMDLPTTVMPFILRGVTLAGIDSVMAPLARRQRAWDRLARDLDPALLETLVEEIPLSGAIDKAQALMAGQVRGRVVVRIRD